MPSSSATVMSIRPKLAGSAAGLNGALNAAFGALLTMLTGLVLPQEGAATVLVGLMLAASGIGLISVYWAIRLQRTKPTMKPQE